MSVESKIILFYERKTVRTNRTIANTTRLNEKCPSVKSVIGHVVIRCLKKRHARDNGPVCDVSFAEESDVRE